MRGIWILIASAGCRQIFGISDPQAAAEDADPTIDAQHTIDSSVIDADNSGEVAHFAFDVIAGNKTPDDIGHHDATCTDATRPLVFAGHRANALQFVNPDYVVIPAFAASDAQARTIALWVEIITPPLGPASDCLLYQTQTLSLCVGSNSQVTFATIDNAAVGDSLVSSHSFSIGTWYHLAVTYDGQTKRIYIDGNVDAADTSTMTSTESVIYVGAGAPSGDGQPGSYANANLDELAMYSRALGPAEILALASQ